MWMSRIASLGLTQVRKVGVSDCLSRLQLELIVAGRHFGVIRTATRVRVVLHWLGNEDFYGCLGYPGCSARSSCALFFMAKTRFCPVHASGGLLSDFIQINSLLTGSISWAA